MNSSTPNMKRNDQNIKLLDVLQLINSVGAFIENDILIGSLIEILVDCMHNWVRIGRNLPVTYAVCHAVAKIAASN